jgi:hypothetical protein
MGLRRFQTFQKVPRVTTFKSIFGVRRFSVVQVKNIWSDWTDGPLERLEQVLLKLWNTLF